MGNEANARFSFSIRGRLQGAAPSPAPGEGRGGAIGGATLGRLASRYARPVYCSNPVYWLVLTTAVYSLLTDSTSAQPLEIPIRTLYSLSYFHVYIRRTTLLVCTMGMNLGRIYEPG